MPSALAADTDDGTDEFIKYFLAIINRDYGEKVKEIDVLFSFIERECQLLNIDLRLLRKLIVKLITANEPRR